MPASDPGAAADASEPPEAASPAQPAEQSRPETGTESAAASPDGSGSGAGAKHDRGSEQAGRKTAPVDLVKRSSGPVAPATEASGDSPAGDAADTANAPDTAKAAASTAPADIAGAARTDDAEASGADGAGDGFDGPGPDDVSVAVNEPLLPARAHRPSDLLRFLLGLFGIAAVLVLASIAQSTTSGLTVDINSGANRLPSFLVTLTSFFSTAAVLIVPVAFAVERLIKRDGLRVADGVLAAVLAHGISLGVDLWVLKAAPAPVYGALVVTHNGTASDPVHGYLTPVIAYMTAVGMSSRPRWRVALWLVVLLDSLSELVGGNTTPLSIAITILLGLTVAYGTLYAVGSPNVRPTGEHLLAGLRKVGFDPITAHRSPDGPEGTRRYLVVQQVGPPLDVHVIDREQQASGFFYRLWRRLRLRAVATRSSPQSLRQALEQEALIAYAANAAGARSPHLIATSELGPDAVILVYERVEGRAFADLADEEITDKILSDAWSSVRILHDRRIAHRQLTSRALLVTEDGGTCLVNLAGGDIAAGDLALRMDVAQLLTTIALRVGPERAVASATEVLGTSRTAAALPMLQPVGLSRSTRQDLKAYHRQAKAAVQAERDVKIAAGVKVEEALEAHPDPSDLLSLIREQILALVPQAPVEPAKLERLKPKTLISLVAGAFAAYLLVGQLTNNPLTKLAHAQWGWILIAVGASIASYVGATMSLAGFVPEQLPFWRTFAAQVAGSFVKLVAPAAVGGVALNARFLQRCGVRPGQAVASVGASQLVGLAMHILLLLGFGFIAGTANSSDVPSARTVITVLLVAAVVVLIVTAIPPLRRWVFQQLRTLFIGVIPRMLDLLRTPSKLATGFGGIILVSIAFIACLYTCVLAFGGTAGFAAIAVVYLAGNAAGSAVPVPGGIGTIDAALILLLSSAAGVPGAIAGPAVLMFRLLTFWLPVLPGWGCFSYLQRRGAL
ncbi:lysylphosphatidylglycerol synthase transmembrane domain-containing protein [Streptacidiphilus anmyonensis]|uniref:lysylphosphatidylglycerol synthase transmembrane domain-containing protein n=1 Tax=Streptacidiphilus anmyonensis TaxID=405782 RepID=UPI000A06CFFC|nr:lysylphosphatidylglycerol synthase transmembrane domain-containing protein [Streptacidiphilus anmyonensis]